MPLDSDVMTVCAAIDLPPDSWKIRQGFYPRDCGVHEVFLDVATRMPSNPAIRTETTEISYEKLDRRANQLANRLIAKGINIGDRVGLLLDRGPELIIVQLAILKAGGIYVPIDPGAPADRVAFYIRDAGLRLMICSDEADTIPASPGLCIFRLGEESEAVARASASNPGRVNKGDDPAYVMYTSGSSGTPKGVEIPHRGIVRLVLCQDYFPAGPDQCTLLLGSPGFDGTTYEIWSALLHGACCAVFPDRWIDHQRLEHVIRKLGVTCLWISTGLFNQIIDHRPLLFDTARHVLVGGEALSASHILRAMEAMPHVQFGNGYGPTECTTFGCAWIIGPPSTWGCDSVPLGSPLNNTECHIVDADLQPVAVGVPGELLLGGDGLALRYLNRPELTAERFIAHPFSNEPGARLYRTGDRCHWLPNGMIAYLGRDDDQVKLRGYRMELGEIEAALRLCRGIENAAVIVHEFQNGVRGLVGCIVSGSPSAWNEDTTLEELALHLPEAMLPNRLFRVDELPLTQNGKVDRRELAHCVTAAFTDDKPASVSYPTKALAPTGFETQILSIWKKVLKDSSLDMDSDFFRHGGDSLVAVELTVAIKRALRREIQAGLIYHFSTPRKLARCLQNSSATDSISVAAEATGMIGSGPGAPVIFVPGFDGHGLLPQPMVEALAGRHPYYDRLSYSALNGKDGQRCSIESIATSLVPQILRVCPEGHPCILLGFSFGGLVAFELARQLADAGRTVEHVILWDAYPVADLERSSPLSIGMRLVRLAFSPSQWCNSDSLQRKLVNFRRRIAARHERATAPRAKDQCAKTRSFPLAVQIAYAYQPQPYTGRVSLLACMKDYLWVFDRCIVDRDGWSKVVPSDRLSVFNFPCGHDDVLNPPFLDAFTATTLDIIGQ